MEPLPDAGDVRDNDMLLLCCGIGAHETYRFQTLRYDTVDNGKTQTKQAKFAAAGTGQNQHGRTG